MKTQFFNPMIFNRCFLMIVFILFLTGNLRAQWSSQGETDNIYKVPTEGNVGIGTDSPTVKLDIIGNVKISNRLYSDTMVVTRILAKDSLIYFGDSTLIFNTMGNAMWTDNGSLRIQSNAANNFATVINQGITQGVGIGNWLPQQKLHIHQDDIGGVHQPVYALFTNEINGYVIPSTTGFKIGISAGLNGEIRQERNLPLNFFTNNTQRVTVLANGNVGIGDFLTVEPKKRLDVFDSTDAQLRLTYEPWAALNRLTFTDFKTTAGGNLLIRPFKNLNGDPHLTNADYGVVGICMGTLPDYYSGGTPGPIVNNQYLALDVNGQQNLRTVTQDTTLEKCSRGG